jgi:diaminopimelate epimerase
MIFNFHKYQGNGNDFVIIDQGSLTDELSAVQIQNMCDRRFGIGADGLIIVKSSDDHDFEMVYYNADGHEASMCGNGARCAVAFFYAKGKSGSSLSFQAYDGKHLGIVNGEELKGKRFDVSISMSEVPTVEKGEGFYFLDTGSPHYVEFVDKVAEIDVVKEGRKTRNAYRFSPGGTNVNFAELSGDRIFVRTYERGVEDETLSCGTGVTASAIAAYLHVGLKDIQIHTTGGDFHVTFEEKDGSFNSIWLRGPAELVFEGSIKVD